MADECQHIDFSAQMDVHRLTEVDGGPVTGFMAAVRIHCTKCGKPFEFLGLEAGLDTQGARVSLDGLEANIALSPQGQKPNPFHRLNYGIKAFS